MDVGPLWTLFLLFLGLRLAGKITWSWWWIFAPLWAVPAIAAATFVVTLIQERLLNT